MKKGPQDPSKSQNLMLSHVLAISKKFQNDFFVCFEISSDMVFCL